MTLRAYAAATATAWDGRAAGRDWVWATGSLLKVDLSGFTGLSERLARSEITGAEHLNTVLNDVFGTIIEEIHARGGDVLQFGGDALLVWFEGPDHAPRAVTAGRAMQRRLAERPAEETPAGAVRLRMSAAVASGDLLLTVVGQDHRELLTIGPVATRVETLEKQARSGQVLVDAETAGALGDDHVTPAGPGAWRITTWPGEVPATRTLPSGEGAECFVPPDVRSLETAGQVVGEHRRSAVAFIGVTGLDALLERKGPAAAVARVGEVAAAVDEAVAATGVTWTATDVMADGSVFLLFAGAPVAREDDEERLQRACRLVLDRCPHHDVRIGAHAGRVFAADVGHPERRTFAIIGDATNLAARLMHRACPGQALVTEDLYDHSERNHEVRWLEPFSVRGRRKPVRAGALGPRVGMAVSRRTHDLPLVGRDRELSRLRALISATAGHGAAPLRLALVGEPGVGKSRLVEEAEALARAEGIDVVHVAGTVFDGDSPYAAARAPLRELLELSDDDVEAEARLAPLTARPELLSLLNLPLGLDLPVDDAVAEIDEQFVDARRHALLTELLRKAHPRPLLLVAEDVQWLDRSTAGLLDTVARRAAPGGIGLLAAARDDPGARLESAVDWETITLAPLDQEHARRLALMVSGDVALSDSELQRLVGDTGGNPLFLRELVSFRPTGAGELPVSAEEVIAARIDALGPARRGLLREVSVGGAGQRLSDVAAALGDPSLSRPAAWEELADFLVVDEAAGSAASLHFRHELYRQSAYGGLAVRRRRVLHGAWADHLLAGSRDPDLGTAGVPTIAVHLHEAGRFAEAWEWGCRAARQARDEGALHDAVPLYERALEAGRRAGVSMGRIAAVREQLGDTAELVGLYDKADEAFRAAARVGPQIEVARRLVKQGTVQERQGRYRAALGKLTRAERQLLPDSSEAERVQAALLLRRSSVLHRQGRLRQAYDVAARVAAAVPGADDLPGRADRARALLRLEMIASEAGWPQRFDLGLEALAAFDGLDEDRDLACLLGNIGVTLWESDDWAGARRRYEESQEVYRRAGDVLGAAIAANNVGEILCEQGDLEGAREVFEDARRVFRAAGHAWGVACTASALGRVAARSGEVDAAGTLLDEATTSLDGMGSTVFAADARVRKVELALITQDPLATRTAATMVESLSQIEVGAVLPLTARRYLAVATAGDDDVAGASEIATQALEGAVAAGVVHEESLLLDLLAGLARLQRREPARELLARRDEIWKRLEIRDPYRYPQVPWT
ncbi:tetratricopeptide repeat protein [Nocardioides sp.]|uniref:tetratricopeptide repeat protein n=1 Tax=Nocardioides sp. TaxID=35761 RepID=UPI002D7F9032|nr:tetratricopeptide repeat protein [Nocardioides sp.]HET8961464.1 tetratricopeptide repeat protein [Nocardioides sp.]